MTSRKSWLAAGIIVGALIGLATGPAIGRADEPLLVTYGTDAPTREGDEDHREVIFFSLPADRDQTLYLRLFDPDVGGRHDLVYGLNDSSTRFSLFGGEGAFSAASADAGRLIAEQTFGADPDSDDRWLTMASFLPSQGERIGERVYFRLVVDGLTGNDGNLFTPAVSLRDRRDAPPADLRLFAFTPTIRMPDRNARVELRFRAPDSDQPITVENFDAANGRVALATRFRTLPLAASGQDAWLKTEVRLRESERGQMAAILFQGGDEIPNDATFRLADSDGQPLAVELPPRRFIPNHRPVPVADAALLADCSGVAFDASRSADRDGDRLSFAWQFGDGAAGDGASLVHRYRPGRYQATLQVTDSSAEIGRGAERVVDVWVPDPPKAAAGSDRLVAVGESVRFDGRGSAGGDRPITRFSWDFGDGAAGNGPAPDHRFTRPGRYLVTLRVEDEAQHACNGDSDELDVVVNAPPVAVAGADLLVAAGDVVHLDGGRSYDQDGRIAGYHWDFGDSDDAEGESVEHRYEQPGVYRVQLTVTDDRRRQQSGHRQPARHRQPAAGGEAAGGSPRRDRRGADLRWRRVGRSRRAHRCP
ncbi:MAG: PKD domain-containing protein [Alphaproteobacteria bacterium]